MLRRLEELEGRGEPIRVAVVGAGGAMGQGIALQIGQTPGMRLVAAVDVNLPRARRAAELHGQPWEIPTTARRVPAALGAGKTVVASDIFPILDLGRDACDVLVESTDTVAFAARAVERALRKRIDVVLMNAEVDCLLGPLLHEVAGQSGAVVSSDAGDQHGVLMRMLDEVRLWGFELVMAGNIKGFLDRSATPETVVDEARKRNLSPIMCTAYTDGTKLNVEMALVSNATGLVPSRRGMAGPAAGDVHEVFGKFDLEALRHPGVVDYIIGAEPGGGVFVIGYCDHPVQQGYLRYYKLGNGPFYLFYRPYHLCHIETTSAIASVALSRTPILTPLPTRVSDVIAIAKTDLAPGTVIRRGVGSEHLYGEIERAEAIRTLGAVPICLFDQDEGMVRVTRAVPRGEPLTWSGVEFPDSALMRAYRRQEQLLHAGTGPTAEPSVLKVAG